MRLIMMVAIVLAVAGLGVIVFRPRIARAAMLSVGATAPDFHSQVVHGDQVTPVRELDDRTIGDGKRGPITQNVMEVFRAALHGSDPRYRSWLYYV